MTHRGPFQPLLFCDSVITGIFDGKSFLRKKKKAAIVSRLRLRSLGVDFLTLAIVFQGDSEEVSGCRLEGTKKPTQTS